MIVIKPKNISEQQFLLKLFKKMNVEAQLVEESIPNRETLQAMKEVESGKGIRIHDINKIF